MRVALLNPNASHHITERMLAEARGAVNGACEIVGYTNADGPPAIRSRVDNAEAIAGLLRLARAHATRDVDAVILGVSMDTALDSVRQMLEVPVVGTAEAALATAGMLGGKIGLLTVGTALTPLYAELADHYGYRARVAGIRGIAAPAAYGAKLAPEVAALMRDAVVSLCRDDGADVVVTVAAALCGYVPEVAAQAEVPVLDGIACAAVQALSLARLRPRKASYGSFALPRHDA
ncbi:aspartate/glutamate racemase family protein [Paraburkholderia susongensis]|uniref:Allantoin racemase n=1 Tax=Paraburkholderia susongensis TaxID=1515439 RepID=A0A1X7ISS8_9BURK|nr:aspartate/glutamate racemase family protein [Paraburkholderia susongensis]SMG17912.1 allantoin racemase [Paraburkholderia susongensis]